MKRPNGRNPSNYPCDGAGVPLRITRVKELALPHVTIDSIMDKNKSLKGDLACIPEMMTLFDCFEKHDFNRAQCKQQMQNLESCYSNHLTNKRQLKSAKR